jgi:hypothetical protein
MTEYEIADLAVSTQAIFWQQWQVAQGAFQNMLTIMERLITVLFGYLLVAHFIGAKLSRVQAGIMTALYLFWVSRLFMVLGLLANNANIIFDEMRKISPIFAVSIPSLLMLYFLLSMITSASLYFMWSVRHPKTE